MTERARISDFVNERGAPIAQQVDPAELHRRTLELEGAIAEDTEPTSPEVLESEALLQKLTDELCGPYR